MVDILHLQEYLDHVKGTMPEINTARLVIDDTQLADMVRDLKESDNLLLLAIVPSHKLDGENEDNVLDRDSMVFLVLKKNDRKVKHSEFINNLSICQKAAQALRSKLIADVYDYNDGCSFLNQLDVPGIALDPLWNLAGCDGYEINFTLHTRA